MPTTRARVLTYILVFLCVVLVFMLAFGQQPPATIGLEYRDAHTILGLIAGILSVLIGTFALIRYYVRRRGIYLWIGAGFLSTALIEGYHAATTAGLLTVVPHDSDALDWSWFAGRTVLASFLLVSWYAGWRRSRPGVRHPPDWLVYLIVGVATVITVVLLATWPEEFTYRVGGAIPRSFDLIPAVLFTAALIGYLSAGQWRKNSFDHALVVALVLAAAGQALLSSFSRHEYDPLFYAAHLIEFASYVAVMAGLLASTYKVFRVAEERRMDSLRKAFELEKERSRVESSLAELRDKETELHRKVAELTTTRTAVLNVMEDLEEEKKKLAQEKAKDEAILSSVGEGLVVTDERRRITYMNGAAEQMTGYATTELLGKRWPDVMHPTFEDGSTVSPDEYVAQRALETLSTRTTLKTFVFHRKDKSEFATIPTAAPVLLRDQPTGVIVVFRDVTREREIDKAKSEFVSLASHQLRTPLSTIKWYAEMLLEGDAGKLTAAQRDYLSETYHANERMVDLVNALLNVSRIELGTFAVTPMPTDVVAVAKTVTNELKPQYASKKIALTEEYEPKLPIIPADANLLRIIFQNLLTNAIKYSPTKGKVALHVRVAARGERFGQHRVPTDSILITVADNGYGIPPAAQPKIFTKLFRADNVRERETDGTGLGLYIVKSILDHSNGDVWFQSTENVGTTFYVLLPVTGMKPKEGAKQLT